MQGLPLSIEELRRFKLFLSCKTFIVQETLRNQRGHRMVEDNK
jgi:hypothetical protein